MESSFAIAMPRVAIGSSRQRRLLLTGVVALLSGVAVYCLFRPTSSASFLFDWNTLALTAPWWLAAVAGSFPTFAHVLAMGAFTALAMDGGRGSALAFTAFWAAFDIGFELAQSETVIGLATDTLERVAPALELAPAVRAGLFDPLDVAAALAAIPALWLLQRSLDGEPR